MEKQRFVDKIALVTGGANGLGRGMVDQLVKEGAQVGVFLIRGGTKEEGAAPNDRACCLPCHLGV